MIAFFKKYDQYTDEELMAPILKGKEKAFNELYARYHQKMYRYFYRMLYQDENLAHDMMQDLFIKVIEKGKTFDSRKKFSTWLYAVAGNMCKNEYRRKERLKTNTEQLLVSTHILNPTEEDFYLPNAIDRSLFENYLTDALAELQDIHRNCFILRYQEELSIKEISEIMNCPEGTVKSRLYYTLRNLADKLQIFHSDSRKKKKTKNAG